MRLLGIDFETTGLDTGNDRITEMGAVLWDTDTKSPLVMSGEYFYDQGVADLLAKPEVAEMILRVSNLTPAVIKEFGFQPSEVLGTLEDFCRTTRVSYLVGHNSENFDKPLLMAELTRHGVEAPTLRSLPWLDTRADIPFPVEPDSRKLKHLALDCGFINPFPHRAVTDVLTMLKMLSHYDINAVIEYSKIPWITIRAVVDYAQKDLAKAQRFSWEKIGDKTYPKLWVKRIKENQLDQETSNCKFKIVRLE